MRLLKSITKIPLYYLFPLVASILFTYNYTDFSLHASIGAGYAYTAKSLALDHTYNIDNYWQQAGADTFETNGHHYIPYAPLPAFAFAVTYFILQVTYFVYTNLIGQINGDFSLLAESIFLGLPSTLALVGTGVVVNKILLKEKVIGKIKSLTIYGVLLGTQLFTYSVTYYKHNLSTFFILLTIYFYLYSKSKYKYLYTSLFIGLSLLTELPTIVIVIPIFIDQFLMLKKKRFKINTEVIKRYTFLALPALTTILILGYLQQIWFGNFFTTGDSLYQAKLISGGIKPIGFDRNWLLGLYGEYLSPIKGLLLISPFLFFAFTINKLDKSKNIVLWGYIAIISILYAKWGDCFGSSPFGPRHISTVIPILAIFAAVFVYKNKQFLSYYKLLIAFSIIFIATITYDGIAMGEYNNCEINNPLGHKKFINRIYNIDKEPAPLIFKQLIYGENY